MSDPDLEKTIEFVCVTLMREILANHKTIADFQEKLISLQNEIANPRVKDMFMGWMMKALTNSVLTREIHHKDDEQAKQIAADEQLAFELDRKEREEANLIATDEEIARRIDRELRDEKPQ